MKRKASFLALCIVIIITGLPVIGLGQSTQLLRKEKPLKHFASTVGGDILYVVTSPLHFNRQDGIKFLTFAATTALFMTQFDGELDEEFIENEDFYIKPATSLARIGKEYDNATSTYVLAGIAVPLISGGLIFGDSELIDTARLMTESLLIAGAITNVAKRLVGRARPQAGRGPHEFDLFNLKVRRDWRSFPSGHATSAFAMMTVLAHQHTQWWIQIPAYTLAVSVAMQRMESRNHWGADVVVGGAIGYWVGTSLVRRHKNKKKAMDISPVLSGNRIGVAVLF